MSCTCFISHSFYNLHQISLGLTIHYFLRYFGIKTIWYVQPSAYVVYFDYPFGYLYAFDMACEKPISFIA